MKPSSTKTEEKPHESVCEEIRALREAIAEAAPPAVNVTVAPAAVNLPAAQIAVPPSTVHMPPFPQRPKGARGSFKRRDGTTAEFTITFDY